MFTGASFSILNYERDIFEIIKGDSVDVYVGEIDHLSPGTVHLADGTEFKSDALLANTGWKHVPPVKFLPEGIERELGIPHAPAPAEQDASPFEDLANQHELMEQVDGEILARFPRLADQPVWNSGYVPLTDQKGISSEDEVTPCKPLTPYMLYHFVVPPSPRFLRPRDTAFVGIVSNFSNMITAHLQGLWVSAYFSGLLENDPAAAFGLGDDERGDSGSSDDSSGKALQKLRHETALHNRFGRWRYPTDWGNKNPNFIFDAVPYLDLLQRDLGLSPYRKGGWLAELYDPYGPEDYRDVNEEWQKNRGSASQPGK